MGTSSANLSKDKEPVPIRLPLIVPTVILSALRLVTVILLASIVPAVSLLADRLCTFSLVTAPSLIREVPTTWPLTLAKSICAYFKSAISAVNELALSLIISALAALRLSTLALIISAYVASSLFVLRLSMLALVALRLVIVA